jgi:hypothetical protein
MEKEKKMRQRGMIGTVFSSIKRMFGNVRQQPGFKTWQRR